DFDALPFGELVRSHVSKSGNQSLLVSDFRLNRDDDYQSIAEQIKQEVPNARVFDGDAFVQHVQSMILSELIRLGTLTLFVVIVIFWLYARRFGEVMRLLLPLIATLACTFGIMGWLNIPFYVLNCIILVFVFGLVDDYCVFLHAAFQEASDPMNDEHVIST